MCDIRRRARSGVGPRVRIAENAANGNESSDMQNRDCTPQKMPSKYSSGARNGEHRAVPGLMPISRTLRRSILRPDLTIVPHRTPIGGLGPNLLLELWADGSESIGAERLLSPLPALAEAEPVRDRT